MYDDRAVACQRPTASPPAVDGGTRRFGPRGRPCPLPLSQVRGALRHLGCSALFSARPLATSRLTPSAVECGLSRPPSTRCSPFAAAERHAGGASAQAVRGEPLCDTVAQLLTRLYRDAIADQVEFAQVGVALCGHPQRVRPLTHVFSTG